MSKPKDGSLSSGIVENGDQDPRGISGRRREEDNGGHHGKDLNDHCPFCDEELHRTKLHLHLPCDDRGLTKTLVLGWMLVTVVLLTILALLVSIAGGIA